jgi:hypothetical protein
MPLKKVTQVLGHSAELTEGKRLAAGGIQSAHMAVGQSCINPGTGSVHCTPRRYKLDSAGSLSGLEKSSLCFQEKPSYQKKEKVAREIRF